jgi:putative peptide zinc metalloprotease protein
MLSAPLLKKNITISAYDQDPHKNRSNRFLLEIGDSHFLLSVKMKVLVQALLCADGDANQLEHHYLASTGEKLSADQLSMLAANTLPAAAFRDTPMPIAEKPFTVSITLLSARQASKITQGFLWLFNPYVVIVLISVFVALHLMALPSAIKSVHATWSSTESLQLLLMLLMSGLLHEFGHTTACRHFNCPHGVIGFGLYYIFPAWYADVSKAWRLPPKQRAVVDLGGVYFQSILLIFLDVYALSTGNPFVLKLIWLITFAMLFTLNPVFKFDGYWLLSDLSGLHNLHRKMRNSFANLFISRDRKIDRDATLTQKWILYVYVLLSSSYFLYFGGFLIHEIEAISKNLPPKLLDEWLRLTVKINSSMLLDIGTSFFHLLASLIWPFIICSAFLLFIIRIVRAIYGIYKSIVSARLPV